MGFEFLVSGFEFRGLKLERWHFAGVIADAKTRNQKLETCNIMVVLDKE